VTSTNGGSGAAMYGTTGATAGGQAVYGVANGTGASFGIHCKVYGPGSTGLYGEAVNTNTANPSIGLLGYSNSGYGIGDSGVACTEKSPLRPLSLYGKTKVQAEAAVLEAGNAVTFRLATVFGLSPRMRLDLLVNDFVHRAVMDRAVTVFEGHAKRNYIHVRDVARAFLHALAHYESMKDEQYNVGLSDANISKIELCLEIKKHLPYFVFLEAPIGQDPDKRNYIVSNAKIEKTGFGPKYGLHDGIQELIKGFTILRNSKYSNV